jgi:hypothetical protein
MNKKGARGVPARSLQPSAAGFNSRALHPYYTGLSSGVLK